jgi:hypothetical protein
VKGDGKEQEGLKCIQETLVNPHAEGTPERHRFISNSADSIVAMFRCVLHRLVMRHWADGKLPIALDGRGRMTSQTDRREEIAYDVEEIQIKMGYNSGLRNVGTELLYSV